MNFKFLRQAVATVLIVATFVISSVFVTSPAMAADQTVIMGAGGLNFSPQKVTASPGDTITFKMGKLGPHNVAFKNSSLDAAAKAGKAGKMMMKPTDSGTLTIPEGMASGSYDFWCTPHRGAGMIGKLIVE